MRYGRFLGSCIQALFIDYYLLVIKVLIRTKKGSTQIGICQESCPFAVQACPPLITAFYQHYPEQSLWHIAMVLEYLPEKLEYLGNFDLPTIHAAETHVLTGTVYYGYDGY